MGCGVSRPITDERSAPVSGGLRPIRRRIEEIKRRRGVHTITNSTPSKKELLEGRVGVEEQEEEEDDDELHTPSELIHDHIQKNAEDGVKSVKELSSMPEKEKEGRMSQSGNTMKPPPPPPPPPAPVLTSGEKRTEVVEKGGGGGGGDKEKDEENEKEEEDGQHDEEENGYGYIDGPGSPSFRDYYVPSIGNSMELTDNSKEEDANGGGKKLEKKSRRNESIASSEGSITQLVKKRNKGRIFRRALPKGLNVKSCYTPPCTSSHDNSHQLLNAKVVHAS